MNKPSLGFLLIPALIWAFFGCSNPNPVTPKVSGSRSADSAPLVWGIWDVLITDDGTVEAVPLRHADFALNVTGMIDSVPGCLGLSVDNIYHHTGYTDITLDISITHPFPDATKFTGFDVMGVLLGNGSVAHPHDPDLYMAGPDDIQLRNADGWTRWMNYPEFLGTDPEMLGFIYGEMGTQGLSPSAIINGYRYFADDLEPKVHPIEYLTNNPANRGMFQAGSTNTRHYNIRFPDSAGFSFQYAVISRWEQNIHSPDPPEYVPDDFPLTANARESVAFAILGTTSDWYWDGSSGGGNFRADISVGNWHVQPGPGNVVDDYVISLYSDAWSGAAHPDMTATSYGPNHCIFAVDIPASPTAAGPLDIWVSIEQTGETYANPFGVPTLAEDEPLVAHFYWLEIVPLISEQWEPPTDHDPRFLFIHHSTGEGFLYDGGMWTKLEAEGFDVHNRTYGDGWVGDNTDPEHWPTTFTDYYDDMISWELEAGQYYDIVAFKSCFPASYIYDQAMLDEYKSYYNAVKTVTQLHPETLFIPYTTPPLVPNETEPAIAARAREFADWLTGAYDEGEFNLVAYDVFDVLAGDDPMSGDFNCLRYEYQDDPWDSHPNVAGSTAVGNDFSAWLSDLVWN